MRLYARCNTFKQNFSAVLMRQSSHVENMVPDSCLVCNQPSNFSTCIRILTFSDFRLYRVRILVTALFLSCLFACLLHFLLCLFWQNIWQSIYYFLTLPILILEMEAACSSRTSVTWFSFSHSEHLGQDKHIISKDVYISL